MERRVKTGTKRKERTRIKIVKVSVGVGGGGGLGGGGGGGRCWGEESPNIMCHLLQVSDIYWNTSFKKNCFSGFEILTYTIPYLLHFACRCIAVRVLFYSRCTTMHVL